MTVKNKNVPEQSETLKAAKEPSNRGPAWDDAFNRVKAAIWKHVEDNGKVRFNTSICRSYKGDDGEWHNVHFYSKSDLRDVITAAQVALDQLDRLEETAAR